MAQIPSQTCTFCSKIAALYCYDCQQCLCTQCQKNIHGIVAVCRDHKVGDIHKAGNRIYKPVPTCEAHNKEFICYCGKCDCLTCKECITSSHNGHITKEIKNIADLRRKDVDQIINKLKTKVEEIERTLKVIDGNHSLQIQSDYDSYIENVEKNSQELYKIIDRYKLINVTTALDFQENEGQDLKRKRVFYQRLINESSDRLLKCENLLQEPHDSTFLTEWKGLQTEFQSMTDETEQALVCPTRLERFNQYTFIRAVIEACDNQFKMGLKEQEMALTQMTEELGELRADVEIKQRTINEITKEAANNIKTITMEFEDKIKHLEAKLITSKEDNNKAVKVQENMKKQLSEANDQYNREREKNTKLQTIILKEEQDFRATKSNKDMQSSVQKMEESMHAQPKMKSPETSYIATFKLSDLELKLLKFFCEDSQIFTGRYEYKDGILMRHLNPTEKEANLQTVFKSKMDFIQSLTSSTIASPSKISDTKFYDIQRAVSDTKDIYCDLSDNKEMITLYASNYDKREEGKHRAEVALGLKQKSKGRRNIVFVTETDLSSSKQEHTLVSDVDQTVKRPAYFLRSSSSSSGRRIEMTFKTSEGIIVKVYNGNILSLNVDCIVNAANDILNHGGGVAYVIAAAAGYDFENESDDYIRRNGPITEGSCCSTSAGKLQYKCVIHTVGPKWHSYNDKTECCRVLRKSVECCFFEAEVNGMSSVAIPSISTGIFGVPKEVCCKEYVKAVEDFSRKNGYKTCLKEIHFIDKDAGMISMIQKEFSQKFNQISSSNTGSTNSGSFTAGGERRITRSLSSPDDSEVSKEKTQNRRDNFTGSMSKFQKQFMAAADLKVSVVQDDIIKKKVSTIVCPQDEKVSNKGGIAKAIEEVCDDKYRQSVKSVNWISKCDIRKVKASPSSLPFQYVLHTVPPRYDKIAEAYKASFNYDLEVTIRNILRHCSDKGDVTSVAMPVLGIGKDGLETPVSTFAKIFLLVLLGEMKSTHKFDVKEIHIVTNDISAAVIVADELEKEKSFTKMTSFSRTRNKGNAKPDTTQDTKAMAGKTFRGALKDGEENCAICMEPIANTKPFELTCGHVFCENCVQECLKGKPVCPTCGSIQGVINGDQPPGRLIRREMRYALPTFKCNTIELEYEINSGTQGEEHPNPGKPFKGIKRVAYFPNNTKGKLIADLLKIAFDRKLVFTIGHSRTTGQEGVVTWNDIHHKTSSSYKHQFGYPDDGYFDRVLDELKIKGVTEKDL